MSAIDQGISDIFLGSVPTGALVPLIGGTLYRFNTTTGENTVFIASTGYENLPFLGARATAFANGPQATLVLLVMTQLGPFLLGKIDHA